jgi:hypothetical protein
MLWQLIRFLLREWVQEDSTIIMFLIYWNAMYKVQTGFHRANPVVLEYDHIVIEIW